MDEEKDQPLLVQKDTMMTKIINRLRLLFNRRCPKCGSRDTEVEVYSIESNGKWIPGRKCRKCNHFGYNK